MNDQTKIAPKIPGSVRKVLKEWKADLEQAKSMGMQDDKLDDLNQILNLGFINSMAANFLWKWADDIEKTPVIPGAEMMRVEAKKVKQFLDQHWVFESISGGGIIVLVKS